MKLVYTSDIHASNAHLLSLLSIAEKSAADAVVIGGDIVPHYLPEFSDAGIVEAQALYLRRVFIPAVKGFHERFPVPIYLDLSNDDFKCHRGILQEHEGPCFRLLHMAKHSLTDTIDIIGYMTVPPTPFHRKDWEKPDTGEMPYAKGNRVVFEGYTTVNGRLEKTVIDPASTDTIEQDLDRLENLIEKPFLFVSHSPPYDTLLDRLDNGLPVGSISIRRFIEKWSRENMLIGSLHGHIHGSPRRSGSIATKLEQALCINPGQNEGEDARLRYIILEIKDQPPKMSLVHTPEPLYLK
jgi:uncharacterized protein